MVFKFPAPAVCSPKLLVYTRTLLTFNYEFMMQPSVILVAHKFIENIKLPDYPFYMFVKERKHS
jgi:hypothetical protein